MDENMSEYVSINEYNELLAQKITVEIRCKELENIVKMMVTNSVERNI